MLTGEEEERIPTNEPSFRMPMYTNPLPRFCKVLSIFDDFHASGGHYYEAVQLLQRETPLPVDLIGICFGYLFARPTWDGWDSAAEMWSVQLAVSNADRVGNLNFLFSCP